MNKHVKTWVVALILFSLIALAGVCGIFERPSTYVQYNDGNGYVTTESALSIKGLSLLGHTWVENPNYLAISITVMLLGFSGVAYSAYQIDKEERGNIKQDSQD